MTETVLTRQTATRHAAPVIAGSGRTKGRSALVFVGWFGAGALVGAAWGAQFRVFMRFVSTDPEFSWSGTLAIVVIFALFGAVQGLVLAGRRLGLRRRWLTPLRVLGTVVTLFTLSGAGAIMAPTTLGGSFARHRSDWPRAARRLLAVIAAINVVAVSVGGAREMGGVLKPVVAGVWLTAIYLGIVAATAPTFAPQVTGWRLPKPMRIALIMAAVAFVGFAGVMLVGVRG